MLTLYRVSQGRIEPISEMEPGCILSLVRPEKEELERVRALTHVSEDALKDALDPNELPRIDIDEETVYAIFSAPWIEGNEEREDFTNPVTLALCRGYTILIDPRGCRSVDDFLTGPGMRHIHNTPTRLMACLFRTIINRYLSVLRDINSIVRHHEKNLGRINDESQLKILHMQNCLTYFQAALRGNELILERIQKMRLDEPFAFVANEEDQDIFDDVMLNLRQAFYTSRIYAKIMDSLMQVHAAALSAKVNTAMKILTALTLVLTFPMVITSAYGMNVAVPFQEMVGAFFIVVGVSLFASAVPVYVLWRKGWFNTRP